MCVLVDVKVRCISLSVVLLSWPVLLCILAIIPVPGVVALGRVAARWHPEQQAGKTTSAPTATNQRGLHPSDK